MADMDDHIEFARKLLDFDFPETHPAAIALSTIGCDHQFIRMWVEFHSHTLPPTANGRNSKLCGVMVDSDTYKIYLTAGWRDNINCKINGLRDGAAGYNQNLVIGGDDTATIQFLTSGGDFLYPNGTAIGDYRNPTNVFNTPCTDVRRHECGSGSGPRRSLAARFRLDWACRIQQKEGSSSTFQVYIAITPRQQSINSVRKHFLA